MAQDVEIRTIRRDERAAVMELHRRHYWRSHCLLLNEDFYHWQFDLAPGNAELGGDQSIVALDPKGNLLSHFSVVAGSCTFRGQKLCGGHILSWLTAPEARGQGIGHRTLRYFMEKYEFGFSRGPRAGSLPIFRRLGFRYFHNPSRWIVVLDADATIRLAVDPDDSAAQRFRERQVRHTKQPNFFVSSKVPDGVGALASTVLADVLAFDRTDDYLRWRYERHPNLKYDFVLMGGLNALQGTAVVRVENVVGRPGRVLRIVEFLAAPRHARALAAAVIAYGQEQGCAFADAWGTSEHGLMGLIACGAFHASEEPDVRLPHLFQPWSDNVETPGFLFHGKRTEYGLGYADDVSRIHVSKGDGNLDWPTWDPIAGSGYAPPVAAMSDAA